MQAITHKNIIMQLPVDLQPSQNTEVFMTTATQQLLKITPLPLV